MFYGKSLNVSGIKFLVLGVLSTGMLACGGGGGNSGEGDPQAPTPALTQTPSPTPTSTTPTTPTPGMGAVDPYNQSECESHANFVWDEGRCALAANPSVINVAQIDSLPEKDRMDLFTWLESLDKELDLDAVFPRWNEDRNDEDISSASWGVNIDMNLLSRKLDGKPYFSLSGEEYVLLAEVEAGSASGTEESSIFLSVNGEEVVSKSARLELVGDQVALSINEQPIYVFSFAESIALGAHLGKSNDYEKDLSDYPVSKVAVNAAHNALIDVDFLETPILGFTEPSGEAKQEIANALSIRDSHRNRLVTTADPSFREIPIAKLSKSDYSAYLRHSYTKIYGEKEKLYAYFVDGVSSEDGTRIDDISIDIFYPSTDLGYYGFSTPTIRQTVDFSYILDGGRTSWTEDGVIRAVSATTRMQMPDMDFEPNIDLASQFVSRNTAIRKSPEFKSGSIYYPAFQAISAPFSNLYTEQDILAAIFDSSSARALFIEKTIPDYDFDDRRLGPTRTLQWPAMNRKMHLFLLAPTEGEREAEARLQTYLDTASQVSPAAYGFVSDLHTTLDTLLAPLTPQQYEVYGPSLVSTSIVFAYRFLDLDNADDILKAISLVDMSLSSSVISLINRNRDIDITLTNSVVRDDFAVQRLSELDAILTEEYQRAVMNHDEIADLYDLPVRRQDFASAPIEELNVDAVNAKIAVLRAIDGFKRRDEPNLVSQADFSRGVEKIAARAYQENWTVETFSNFEVVLGYLRPFNAFSRCDDKETVSEKFVCIDRFTPMDRFLTVDTSRGYLGWYEGAENPYVANASVFAGIFPKLDSITDLTGTVGVGFRLRSDYRRLLEQGALLSCSPVVVGETVTRLSQILDEIQAILDTGVPRFGSEEYDAVRQLEEQFEELSMGC